MTVEPYSYFDLGYVFRKGGPGEMLVAMPLLYPATLALLDLWRRVKPMRPRLLDACSGIGSTTCS